MDDARQRGEVAKSQDLASWASLAGTAGAVAIAGGWMCQDLARRLLPFISQPEDFRLQAGGAVEVGRMAIMAAAPALALILGVGMVTGVAGNLIQTGFLWATDKLKPDVSKISPLSGFKRLFGLDGFVQFIKSIIKLLLVAATTWMVMKPHGAELPGVSVFYKDDAGEVFHTYSTFGRGVEVMMHTYNLLDLTAKGRDEDGLDFTMAWVRHHDRYEEQPAAKSCCGGGA